MKFAYFLVALLVVIGLACSQECGCRQFQCDNGRCIPEIWICDGNNDCGDMSDEPEHCANCTGEFRCANGNCVNAAWICDGDNDCFDNSDEVDPETGECPLCPDTHFTCPSTKRCIPWLNVCDGVSNCRGGEDELDPEQCPACGDRCFRCATGRCIDWTKVCDGQNNCGDRSDEPENPDECPACKEGEFRCGTGRCIVPGFICNGRDDCGDRSDEPENPEDCPPCDKEQFRCDNGHCLPEVLVCNGRDDCGDRSDELENPDDCPFCDENQFRCNNGRCITGSFICDGTTNNCGDWSDESEELCPCADDEFRCSNPPTEDPNRPGNCIPSQFVCDEDGIWDCPTGSDEENCTMSRSVKQTQDQRGQMAHLIQEHYAKGKYYDKPSNILYVKKNEIGKRDLFQKMIEKYATGRKARK